MFFVNNCHRAYQIYVIRILVRRNEIEIHLELDAFSLLYYKIMQVPDSWFF